MNTYSNYTSKGENQFQFIYDDILSTASIYTSTYLIDQYDYPLNIYDDKKIGLIIEVSAIGLSKDEIDIVISDIDILTISHTKNSDDIQPIIKQEYIYKGMPEKSFKLAWKIDAKYEMTNLSADLKAGLLTITIPYKQGLEPKKININE